MDADTRRRVHEICKLTGGGARCLDEDAGGACTPENCYVMELIALGQKNADVIRCEDRPLKNSVNI